MRIGRLLLIVVAALLAAGPHVPGADQPRRLEITAAYISYGDLDGSWQLTLKDPGEAKLLSYKRINEGEQPVVISLARLSTLRSIIENERFFELREQYGQMPVDGPERRMTIRQGGKAKKVTVYSVRQDLSKREAAEVDRAMRVWFTIRDCFQDADASP